jgi:hypothetical protein
VTITDRKLRMTAVVNFPRRCSDLPTGNVTLFSDMSLDRSTR